MHEWRMKHLQPLQELETWWERPDPWEYENNPDDLNRRAMLLSVLPRKKYKRILDIGCGNGFVTHRLPGEEIIGIDVSANAIHHARESAPPHIQYHPHSLFQLPHLKWKQEFDLIVITGVLYPQYIGRSNRLVYLILDDLLKTEGDLVCCHIEEWYGSRFPYVTLSRDFYPYREYVHVLEVYRKT
jgi:predicted TPR repeat methyltransferase